MSPRLPKVIVVVLLGCILCVCRSVHAQRYASADDTFKRLFAQARLLHDSIPVEARRILVEALKVSEGQTTASMARLYNELGSVYRVQGDFDSSLLYYRKGLNFARAAEDPVEIVAAYQGIGDDMRNLSYKDSSHFYLDRAVTLAKEHMLYAFEAGLYNDLGNLYRDEDDLQTALTYYFQSATLYKDHVGDDAGLSRALSNVANVHYLLRNYDKALDYIDQSNDIARKTSHFRGVAYNHKLAGRIYRQKKDLPKALEEYQAALAAYQTSNDRFNMSETLLGIGNLRYDGKDYEGAINDYQRGLAAARSIGVKSLIAYCYSALGFAHYSLKRWRLATAYMDSTRVTAAATKKPYLLMDAYQILGSIEEEQHHYEKSLAYVYQYIALKDSLTTAENRQAIEDAEARYQNDRKTAEIELLRKDQEIQATMLQRNRIITAGVGLTLLAVVIIGSLVFNRYKILNVTKRQIELERVRNQIARDLHDDIGSTLSSINIISQLALKEDGREKPVTSHFQRIHDHSSRMMENMADIVWSIHPENDSMEKVVAKMKEFCGEILETKDILYSFENVELLSGITLNIESRKNLFLIFKEIINNAAKYSQATSIKIVFSKSHGGWTMDIADNGRGFDKAAVKKGNGLINIQKRAAAMNAVANLLTDPGKGTTITMQMSGIT